MRSRVIAAIAVIGLAVIGVLGSAESAQAAGTTFYVNNQSGSNCSDSGAGSITQPYCTFSPLNSHGAFSPGDSILLAKGATWDQQLTLSGSGTTASPITVGAYGSGANPKIQRNDSVDDRGIKLVDGDNWNFNDLEVSHAASGILAYYDTYGHSGLNFNDIYVHNITGLLYYEANGTGSQVASALADNVRNSSGIQITGKYSTFTTSQYFVKNVRMNYISGDHNLNTIGIDALQPNDQTTANVGSSGAAGANLVQNVVIDHLYSHDDNWQCSEALRLFTVTHGVVMNSNFNNEAPCHNNGGTTVVILGHLEDVSIVNSIFSNVTETNSNDEDALDFEIFNDNVRARDDLFENTPGSAMSFLLLGGRPGDYSTNNEASGNVFVNNGVAKYGGAALNVLNATGASTITGTLSDNVNLNRGLYNDQGYGFLGFSTTNDQTIQNGTGFMYFAPQDFSGSQGANGWTYQSDDSGTYTNLVYSASTNNWTPPGQSVPEITQFDEHPGNSTTNWVARGWTAPVSGTVDLRGRILKSDNTGGGNGVLAKITKNGTTIWPTNGTPTTINAGDEYTGVAYALNNVSVNAGDVIRFEVNENGENSSDKTSWTPSVTYTASTTKAYDWGFAGGAEDGWTVNGATTTTATGSDLEALNLTSTGGDPQVVSSTGLHINAAVDPTVTVRMNNATSNTTGKVYFIRTTDSGFSESREVTFTVAPNSGYVTYTVPMSSNANWTGEIGQLRVDPIEAAGAVKIDDVTVVGSGQLYVNRLQDVGFEDPSADKYTYNPTGSPWSYAGSTGVQRNGSAFSGTQGANSGQQTAFIQGTDSISQALNLSSGSHTFAFALAQRTSHGGAESVDVYVDGSKVNASSFSPPAGGSWGTASVAFSTTAGVHTIQIRGTNAGDNTAFIDSSSLN